MGIISALVGRHDYVICDRENHASIYAGCQLSYGKMLRYRHSDMAELEKLPAAACRSTAGALIVTDGVFSMGGDIAKLPEICALAEKYGARVMVDDAHGLGVLGEGGRGTASYFRAGGQGGRVHGHVLQVAGVSGRLHGRIGGGGGVCAPRLPALHLLGVHSRRPTAPRRWRHCGSWSSIRSCRSGCADLSLYARKGLTERGLTIRPSALEAPTPIIPIYTYETIPHAAGGGRTSTTAACT